MKKYITPQNILIAALTVAIFVLNTCKNNRYHNTVSGKDIEIQLLKQKTDSIINQKNQVIYEQEALIVKNQEDLKRYTDSIFDLKRKHSTQIKSVVAYYSSITNTRIDSVPVPYVDTLTLRRFSDSIQKQCGTVLSYMRDSTISVPRRAKIDSTNFSIDLTIGKSSVLVNNVTFVDSQYIRFIERKGGLFKKDIYGKRHFILKPQIVVQVLHSNQNIKVMGQQSAIYIKKSKFLPKLAVIGGAVLTGILIK